MFSSEELRLAKKWFDDGVTPADIAERLGRDKSTVTRDFALWKEINRRMRRQELKWACGRRGSRD